MLSWCGDFSDAGAAYPLINRHMTEALDRAGVRVLRNQHNDGTDLTPLAVVCAYPPQLPNVRHDQNVVFFTWEFDTFPRSFLRTMRQADRVLVMSQWVADNLQPLVQCPVDVVPLGFDPREFTPQTKPACWTDLFPGETWADDGNATTLLWVGGTDARHGLDVAVRLMDRLPDDYHLIAKVSAHYPEPKEQHPRVHFLRCDLPSLAPLYRAADVFLHTARAVGFSLPVLEAMACGTRVVSTDLPPVNEFGLFGVDYAGGTMQSFQHHIHHDFSPTWLEPDVDELTEAVRLALKRDPVYRKFPGAFRLWREAFTWDAAARRLIEVLEL